jgi:hypothetical protein
MLNSRHLLCSNYLKYLVVPVYVAEILGCMACSVLLMESTTAPLMAQTISAVQPRTCVLGSTTRLTLQGADLNESLRTQASLPGIPLKIVKIEPTRAEIDLTVPSDTPLGPCSLWIAGPSGLIKQQTLFIDDVASAVDNGQNHSLETAQSLSLPCSLEGSCDAAHSDYYRFQVEAAQRVAFEVHAQQLRSPMDPVVRLLNAQGKILHQVDDSQVGPDCRFQYDFTEAGEYWLQISDSRHAAAGASYQLRLGDFPLAYHCFPLAAQAGTKSRIEFIGPTEQSGVTSEVTFPPQTTGTVYVSGRVSDGQASTWLPILVTPTPQVMESQVETALSLPVGISGRLDQPRQIDSYRLLGTQGQTLRISTKTRSLGTPTLLRMRLVDAQGKQLAETKVADTDEWSMEATLPADGEYRLEAEDLLQRGGWEYAYWIDVSLAGSFEVALKADAGLREDFSLEPGVGACAVDLSVSRFGYDGEIELSVDASEEGSSGGLHIVNPRIAASATAARIYLQATADWQAGQLSVVKLRARAAGSQDRGQAVGSVALYRTKEPHVLHPQTWATGALVLTGIAASDALFGLETVNPVQFARPLNSHTATLKLNRLAGDYKGNVEILDRALPTGWTASATADKDLYTLTVGSTADAAVEPTRLPLLVFGNHNSRGRLESFELPIEWIDPLQVSLGFPQPLVRGGYAQAVVELTRQGTDPQPVTLKLSEFSAGITGPESLTLAADQSRIQFEIKFADDLPADAQLAVRIQATSKYAGQEFTLNALHAIPQPISSPEQLNVFPSHIALSDPSDQQQIVVTSSHVEQGDRDWTRAARYTIANPQIAEMRGTVVHPLANGETEVTIELGSVRHTIPLHVNYPATPRPIGFESEVLVALSKQGCNSGACHGSPSGKGGFRLSLRAFDKQLDELTLIREDYGRRINTLEPEQSLLLLKPLMKVSHGGGKQLQPNDAAYRILQDWVASGAHSDPPDTPRVTRLEVFPNQKQVLGLADGGQQLAVVAHFADNSRRDVTHLVAYESSNTSVATVDDHGFVSPQTRGEAAILVRYLEFIETLPLMFTQPQEGFQWTTPPENNYVDALVNAKLQQLQYLPAETCSDAEFLRRVSLDVIGGLPTIEETQAFLADPSPDKRSRWIDGLLDRPEYAKFWALKWGDLLKMTGKLVGDEGVYKYHRWVEDGLRENVPYDQFARQLLTGAGSTLANPPANFYRTATDMNECVETISQVFLGARLQCAKCHNHPFERWTQDNYYGLGAFFHRVQRRKTERPGEMFIYTAYSGDVTQPRTGQVMEPWLPQQGTTTSPDSTDRREIFAEWLVNPENPYFARIEANRIWSQLFARGIVDPIDDFRDSNPPSNGPLLDALAQDFVDSGFDRKHLLRVILNSRTYQSSYQTSEFNREDQAYFSHQEPRLLSAEQLLDAINASLGLTQTFGGLPAGTKATQLPAPDLVKVDFLKVFGQPERSTVCACERADDSNLGMAIELFNGPMIHDKLRDASNRFRLSLAAGKSVEEVVRELYLAALCRPPADIELQTALAHCAQSADPAAGVEDVCWALFNTDEFLFQH